MQSSCENSSLTESERRRRIRRCLLDLLTGREVKAVSLRSAGNDEQIRHLCKALKLLTVVESFPADFEIKCAADGKYYVCLRSAMCGDKAQDIEIVQAMTFRSLKKLIKWGANASNRASVSPANPVIVSGEPFLGPEYAEDRHFDHYSAALHYLRRRKLLMTKLRTEGDSAPLDHHDAHEEDQSLASAPSSPMRIDDPVRLSPIPVESNEYETQGNVYRGDVSPSLSSSSTSTATSLGRSSPPPFPFAKRYMALPLVGWCGAEARNSDVWSF